MDASDDIEFAGLMRRVGNLYLQVCRVDEEDSGIVYKLIDFHAFEHEHHVDQLLDSVPKLMCAWRIEGMRVSTLRGRFGQLSEWWLRKWGGDLSILCSGTMDQLSAWDKVDATHRRMVRPFTSEDLQTLGLHAPLRQEP
ncbi:hypothetical protein B484DRAFT_423832 [Ochromonadaceae sp. CCMP2298]|nr:hypothetical protein B484DRAFT_423832 [Ochromonadaceae sp. CCMP2298]